MALTYGHDLGTEIDYPESDGSLIAESDWHRDEIVELIFRLRTRYADRADTYVSGHMFVYYEEGKPAAVFAPDVMVAFGASSRQRRVYKLWEEGAVPAVVFEVSSRKTRRKDLGSKRRLCERLGIDEYFLWDPRYEFLTPPLQGFRLDAGTYREIARDSEGCLISGVLGLRLCARQHLLELYDLQSGDRLIRSAEAARIASWVAGHDREA